MSSPLPEAPATSFTAQDPEYASRVRESFARQGVMGLLGAEISRLEPGLVEIRLAHRPELTQQHGFFHAGVMATAMDSAGGYASFTLMPTGSSVLAVEFKISLMRPGDGDLLVARGQVLRPGRTLSTCRLEAFVRREGGFHLAATGLQTVICLPDREDAPTGRG